MSGEDNTVQVLSVETLDWNAALPGLAMAPTPNQGDLSELSEPGEPLEPFEPVDTGGLVVPGALVDPGVFVDPGLLVDPGVLVGPGEPIRPSNWAGGAADPITGMPVFSSDQPVLEDGEVSTAEDGRTFYRPLFRLADRATGIVGGPDVAFHRDDHGRLRFEFTVLGEPGPVLPSGALPLPMLLQMVYVTWNGGDQVFESPELTAVDTPDGTILRLRCSVDLDPTQARTLEIAMTDPESGCELQIHGSFEYGFKNPGNGQLDYFIAATGVTLDSTDPGLTRELALAMFDEQGWDANHRKEAGFDEDEFQGSLPFAETRTSTVTRVVPFGFDPEQDIYAPIYAALHGTADLPAQWRKSAAGWLRDSGFPNTVYRLPDELRLAFHPDLGTPHVVTTLHQGADGAAGVRVLLRVAPWQDPRLVVQARELVGARTAQVVVGPVASATLRLGGSFPENIRVLGTAADGVPVTLSGATDLLLDLSLEYFQLLCGMIGGPVGLPGQVDVTLDDAVLDGAADGTGAGGKVAVSVPVNLRMNTVTDLPVAVDIPDQGGASPTTVRLTNKAGTAVRIGGCAAVFVQTADGSVVPLGTRPARCTTAFPIELAAGGTAELAFQARDAGPDDRWNAIMVELLDKAMVADASAMLLKANQVAGTGELTWTVQVSCPVFATEPRPPRWANLAALEVEITAAGFDATSVVLDATTPATSITMRQPLADIVAGRSAGIRTATFRVRNNYADHQGRWTEPQQQSGAHLIAYPNQAADD